MMKILKILLIGIIIFTMITVLSILLAIVKAWERGLHFDIWVALPIASKFGLYGAMVIMTIVSLAKFNRGPNK
jgi:ABC-type microcin C transport system permease subunit YejB